MKKFRGLSERIKTASSYNALAVGMADRVPLALLGFLNGNLNSRSGFVSRLARRLGRPMSVRPGILGGLKIFVDPRDATHMDIFDEVVLQNAYDLSRVRFEPDWVIDCGGHIGLFTLRAAAAFPKAQMTVFEPMPRNLEFIRRSAKINALAASIRAQAVSDECGQRTFYERNSCGGSLSSEAAAVNRSYPVEVIDLLSLVRDWKPQRLLLKMDIEGEEENLLPKLAAVLPGTCAIFFETHRFEAGWNRVGQALMDHGFEVTLLRSRDPFRDGFALRTD